MGPFSPPWISGPCQRRAYNVQSPGIAAFPSHFERSTSAPTESIDSVPPARRGADGLVISLGENVEVADLSPWRLTLLHIIYPARWMEDDHFPFFSWVMAVGEPAVKIFQGVNIFGNNPTQMVPFCGSTYWFPPGFFSALMQGQIYKPDQVGGGNVAWNFQWVEFGWSQQN